MRVIWALALAFGLAGGVPAEAGVFELPEDNGIVSLTLPNSWKQQSEPGGTSLSATSADGLLDFGASLVDDAKSAGFLQGLLAGDPKRGLVADPASEERDSLRIAARRVTDLTYRTKGAAGRIRILRMEIVPGKILFMRMMGTAAAFDVHDVELNAIFKELKPLDN